MWSTLVPHYLLHVLDVDGDNHYAEIDSLPNYTTYSSTAQRYENAVAKETPKDAKDPTDKNIMIPDLLSKIRLLERDSRRGFTEEFRVLNIFCMFCFWLCCSFTRTIFISYCYSPQCSTVNSIRVNTGQPCNLIWTVATWQFSKQNVNHCVTYVMSLQALFRPSHTRPMVWVLFL